MFYLGLEPLCYFAILLKGENIVACEKKFDFEKRCLNAVGVPLLDGGSVRLPKLIGLSRALDLILTGRPVKADEALQMGLANRVTKPGTGG